MAGRSKLQFNSLHLMDTENNLCRNTTFNKNLNQGEPRRAFEFKSCRIIHISSHFETGKVETKLKQNDVRVFKMNFTALPVYICENINGLGLWNQDSQFWQHCYFSHNNFGNLSSN